MIGLIRIAALSLAALIGSYEASAQMITPPPPDRQYFSSFLNRPPTKDDLARLPAAARDVITAKIRIVEGPTSVFGRHGEYYGPPPAPRYRTGATVEIVAVLMGNAAPGATLDVYFVIPGTWTISPATPGQKARDYFIVSHVGDDGRRGLVQFPISEREYEELRKEISDHDRARGWGPGLRK